MKDARARTGMPRISVIALLAIVVGILGAVGVTAQQTRTVPTPYATIQAAIDAANPRDVVAVGPGTYRETIYFKGKDIIVASVSGPEHTTIDAGRLRIPAVTFTGGETPRAFLRGFTITRSERCGIYISQASNPSVVDCVIVGNSNWVTQLGGGVYSEGAGSFIRTRFFSNGVANNSGIGGGLSGHGVTLIDCVFAYNHATYGGAADGSGKVIGCVVYGNSAEEGAGGLDGAFNIVNSVVWGNVAWYVNEISGGTATYSCVGGGYPGVGNIGLAPQFADPINGDFHLKAASPCIGRGSNAAVASSTDFEGDPRVAPANGTVDMGADEVFPHLYHIGTPKPGATIAVKFAGPPNAAAFWGWSNALASPPIPIPGLVGSLGLHPNGLVVLPIAQLPANGVLRFDVTFPPNFPSQSIPTQALIGTHLTNLDVVLVR